MIGHDRREFLKLLGSGGLAAALPASIARAVEIRANNRTGTIQDVEHIVILTQENRSFDHYFGTLNGVRGFNDPRAVKLPSGKPVWYQPGGANFVLPFRPEFDNVGNVYFPDPPHGWNDGHAAWNKGMFDQWVPNKGASAMAYLTRKDLSFHYALADAFTICDAYYCSVKGPTDPNRYHLWTGWLGNDGKNGGPVITNAEEGYDWSTYPERLVRGGVSWKVYQDIGHGLDAPNFWGWTFDNGFIGNFGDNSLLYFHQYQNATPGNPLADFGKVGTNIEKSGGLFDMLRNDVLGNKLPQVSWITAPESYSEHPNWPANFGAWYISQVIDALTANPEVWAKTVLFINYDEEGGFFDHMVPPNPPESPEQGASTVDTVNEILPANADHRNHVAGHIGLGMRVPMLVVSPWSKGGFVNSQVFDHTSLIQFIEARYGVGVPDLLESNITPWRRAVVGDLTSTLNFRKPNAVVVKLPNTDDLAPPDFSGHKDDNVVPPAKQVLPQQEKGVRHARALPYRLHAQGKVQVADNAFDIEFKNSGSASAVFHVRSSNPLELPRDYTVEPGKTLVGRWGVDANGLYSIAVHGPNGFYRSFKGGVSEAHNHLLALTDDYDDFDDKLNLEIESHSTRTGRVRIVDQYSNERTEARLPARRRLESHRRVTRHFGWYDLLITVDEDPTFEIHLAGHIENGRDSITDPMLSIGG